MEPQSFIPRQVNKLYISRVDGVGTFCEYIYCIFKLCTKQIWAYVAHQYFVFKLGSKGIREWNRYAESRIIICSRASFMEAVSISLSQHVFNLLSLFPCHLSVNCRFSDMCFSFQRCPLCMDSLVQIKLSFLLRCLQWTLTVMCR